MLLTERTTIVVLFHTMRGRQFKAFYRSTVCRLMTSEFDRVLLRKRSLVEVVFDQLKNLCQIEHTRHRSLSNFAVNLMAGIVAYCLQPVKLRIALRDSPRDMLAVN